MRLLLAFLLTATPAAARPVPPEPASALQSYVLGRYAFAGADLAQAAHYFDAAQMQDPGRPALARRAFDLAVAAGDKARAIDLARSLGSTAPLDSDIALIRLTDAILRRDWKAVDTARTGLSGAGYAVVVGPIVAAWALYGRGDHEAALARLDPAAFTGFARSYVAEQRAHMLAADGRWTDAATAYADLRAGTGGGINFLALGEADARAQAGDVAAAQKLVAGDDPGMAAARARLAAGKRIGALAPDPRRGIAWMAARLATDLSREQPVPLALQFARVATFLAPDLPAAWLICGDVLARFAQRDAALAAYDRIAGDDALADAVRARRAEVLEAAGRSAAAGDILKARVTSGSATAEDWTRLGDWHRRGDRFAEAIAAYSRALPLAEAAGGNPWGLYFLRATMREKAGDCAAAEADLREALKRSPDEPVVLNYLGYSLLDRNQNLAEASAMVARAAQLRPGDGGIIDSLGWSQYRQGQFAAALATLEQAAALEPGDATVTEHLGDALWQNGRRIEARFRWRAALDLDPDAAQKKLIRAKLDYGPDAALAMTDAAPPR